MDEETIQEVMIKFAGIVFTSLANLVLDLLADMNKDNNDFNTSVYINRTYIRYGEPYHK